MQIEKYVYICTRKSNGAIAQLVEHRTENPGVPSSILGGTTLQKPQFFYLQKVAVFLLSARDRKKGQIYIKVLIPYLITNQSHLFFVPHQYLHCQNQALSKTLDNYL